MLQRLFSSFVLIVLLASCDYKPVNPALWTFGNPEWRFKKVLKHYSSPEDSLKLKAAKFLIRNMGEHFYYVPKNEMAVDSFYQYLNEIIKIPEINNNKLHEELREELLDIYVPKAIKDSIVAIPEYRKRSDVKTISPEFLIENIEYAFKAWELPWARSVSFEDFCRYILPYRYENEQPELWRKEIFDTYCWIADSLNNPTDILEAATFINKQFVDRFSHPSNMGAFRMNITDHLDLMAYRTCMEQAGIGICIFRALGIPATKISIPRWGNRRQGHDFTGVLVSNNKWRYINFGDADPQEDLNYEAPKMFFKRFDNMQRFTPLLDDASALFMHVNDLEVNIIEETSEDIYMCVFGGYGWVPLFQGENQKSKVVFRDVGNKHQIYLAAVNTGKGLKPVSFPFSADSIGNITYYPGDSIINQATFYRKYPYAKNKHIPRLEALIGGKFSVSNDSDFLSSQLLYTVDTMLNYFMTIIPCTQQNVKYLRFEFPIYDQPDYDGPAEIAFYTTQNDSIKKIDGKIFGSSQLSDEHIGILTDNDILTYVEVWDCPEELNLYSGKFILTRKKAPIWIALEADSATTVTHVGICPRNDKNGIYAGMHYELFYWDHAWKSLGTNQATSDSIIFENVPANAVMWLKNRDEGNEEWIFTMKDGKQEWR